MMAPVFPPMSWVREERSEREKKKRRSKRNFRGMDNNEILCSVLMPGWIPVISVLAVFCLLSFFLAVPFKRVSMF